MNEQIRDKSQNLGFERDLIGLLGELTIRGVYGKLSRWPSVTQRKGQNVRSCQSLQVRGQQQPASWATCVPSSQSFTPEPQPLVFTPKMYNFRFTYVVMCIGNSTLSPTRQCSTLRTHHSSLIHLPAHAHVDCSHVGMHLLGTFFCKLFVDITCPFLLGKYLRM